jgi:hypothetical protein
MGFQVRRYHLDSPISIRLLVEQSRVRNIELNVSIPEGN